MSKSSQSGLPADQQTESYTYTNADGQVIAKEVRTDSEKRMTYTVYDDLGRERYVIPAIQDQLITSVGTQSLEKSQKILLLQRI